MSNTIYLITGANRGIGNGLVDCYLSKPNNTVIAGVRDPDHPTSKALSSLSIHSSSKLIVLKLESASESDAAAVVTKLKSDYNINHLDVVIANAGILKVLPTVADVKPADMQEHYLINVIGPVLLFQAVAPLLKKSEKQPKFVAISSMTASMGDGETWAPFHNAAYSTSKAALNFILMKIHFEHPDIISFPICPGWVKTDMGTYGAITYGREEAEISVEESNAGVVKMISEATREKTSGKFWNYAGDSIPW